MTVLVDDATWSWQGRRWAHLVSDESLDELHELAQAIGLRRLGFQGDHYDVDVVDRDRAIERGASAVGSRELVRRLRDAGLRRADTKPRWWRVGSGSAAIRADATIASIERMRTALLDLDAAGRRLDAVVPTLLVPGLRSLAAYADERRLALLAELDPATPDPTLTSLDVDYVVVGGPRRDGDRSVEVFVDRGP